MKDSQVLCAPVRVGGAHGRRGVPGKPIRQFFSRCCEPVHDRDPALTTDTVTVTGAWPTATFLNASATSVARGAWVKLTATPWQRVAGTWSNAAKVTAKTTIQWQRGSDWYNGTSLSTSPAVAKASTVACRRLKRLVSIGGTLYINEAYSTSAAMCAKTRTLHVTNGNRFIICKIGTYHRLERQPRRGKNSKENARNNRLHPWNGMDL